MTTKGLVFIDSQVEGYEHLLQGVCADFQAFAISSLRNGIEQISHYLKHFSNIESLHIITHGQPGRLLLGDRWIDANASESIINQMKGWSQFLTPTANISLYGCHVGLGDRGRTFIETLKLWTGADVAAASTLIGSAAKGGTWDLNVCTGAIASTPALTDDAKASFPNVLVRCIPNPMYAVVNDAANNEADLYILNLDTGEAELAGSVPGLETFAMAREAETGKVYFIEGGSDNPNVFFFDPFDNSSGPLDDDTGIVTGGSSFLKMAQQAGTNRIFAMEADTVNLYTVDVDPDDPTAGGMANVEVAVTSNLADPDTLANPFGTGSGDIAFDPTDPDTLFATVVDVGGGDYNLYSIDVSDIDNGNAVATFVGDVADGGTILSTANPGNLAFGQDGELYLTSDGVLYQVDQDTAAATEIGPTVNVDTGADLEFTDFATLPVLAEEVDVSLVKTDNNDTIEAGEEITYTITVSNPADCDIVNLQVSDVVSPSIENVSYTTSFITGSGNFPVPEGTGNTIDLTFRLNANSTAQITITGTVSSTLAIGTEISNLAQVELPPGLPDPDPDNNISSDITTVGTPDNGGPPPGGGGGGGTPPGGGGGGTPPGTPCADGLTLRGDGQRNRLTGTPDSDTLVGRGGNDRMFGKGCNDFLNGGRGNDRMRGGGDQDELRGRQDNDRLSGGPGFDQLFGGLGNDRLIGADGDDVVDGGRGDDVMDGNAGADVMRGEVGDDQMKGNTGNDIMDGGTGEDTMRGGFGNDEIRGRQGRDLLFGDAGNDAMFGGNEADRLQGGNGNDTLHGAKKNDVLFGQQKIDRIFGNAGSDRLNGGPGRDVLNGGIGKDQIYGGSNDDRLFGDKGDDFLFGENGNDEIRAGAGADTSRGGLGNDDMQGNAGNDALSGDQGNDFIRGNLGNDNLAGNAGLDILNGALGNDTLNGGENNDRLEGGAGDDSLFGGSGRDFLVGGFGDDFISGGAANDALIGNQGNDRLQGNSGRDQFIVQAISDRRDIVLDFEIRRDFINFQDIFDDARYGQADRFNAYVQLVDRTGGTAVQVDGNGDRAAGGFRTVLFLNDVESSQLRQVDFLL